MLRVFLLALASIALAGGGAFSQSPGKSLPLDRARMAGDRATQESILTLLVEVLKTTIADTNEAAKLSREELAASLQPVITQFDGAFGVQMAEANALKQSLEGLKRQMAENRPSAELNRQIKKVSADAQRLRARLAKSPEQPNVLGKVKSSTGKSSGEVRSICEMARDARKRNSPAAASLEAQCRSNGGTP